MEPRTKAWLLVGTILIVLVSLPWAWAFWPEPVVAVGLDKTIEKMAAEKGIRVTEVAELKNVFTKAVGFGGAGGQGTAVIVLKDVQNFFETIGSEEVEIFVANELNEVRNWVNRKYWATKQGYPIIFEYTNSYSTPVYYYTVSEISALTIIFGKSSASTVLISMVVTVLGGMLGCFIAPFAVNNLDYRFR